MIFIKIIFISNYSTSRIFIKKYVTLITIYRNKYDFKILLRHKAWVFRCLFILNWHVVFKLVIYEIWIYLNDNSSLGLGYFWVSKYYLITSLIGKLITLYENRDT